MGNLLQTVGKKRDRWNTWDKEHFKLCNFDNSARRTGLTVPMTYIPSLVYFQIVSYKIVVIYGKKCEVEKIEKVHTEIIE